GVVGFTSARAFANGAWSLPKGAMYVVLLTIAGVVLTRCIDVITQRLSTALAAFVLAIMLGITANVFGMTGSASLAKETGAMALTLLPVWAIALLVPGISVRSGLALVVGPLWMG